MVNVDAGRSVQTVDSQCGLWMANMNYAWSIWVVTVDPEGVVSVDCGQSMWTNVEYG